MTAASPAPAPAVAQAPFLIIEDERDLTNVLTYNMKREGYETRRRPRRPGRAAQGPNACCPTWCCST